MKRVLLFTILLTLLMSMACEDGLKTKVIGKRVDTSYITYPENCQMSIDSVCSIVTVKHYYITYKVCDYNNICTFQESEASKRKYDEIEVQ